jgi:hypothetical protein
MLSAAVAATAIAVVLSLVVLRVPPQAEQLVAVAQEGQVQQDDGPASVLVSGGVDDPATGSPAGSTGSSVAGVRAKKDSTVLGVGDSHAYFWREGFTRYAKQKGFRVVFVTSQGCPWMDIPALSAQTGKDHECQRTLWEPALAAAREYRPDVTLLISRSVLSRTLQTPRGVIKALEPGWEQIVRDGTTRSLAQMVPLSGKVVLIEPFPQTRTPMLDCLTEGTPPARCDQPALATAGTETVESLYRQLDARNPTVVSVSLDDVMCPDATCPALVNGSPTFSDSNHLSWDYASSLMPAVAAALRDAGAPLTGR